MPVLRSTSSLTLAALIFCSVISASPTLMAQASQPDKPQEGGQPPASGGVNTGGVHAPVLDQEHRPITAGGFVKTGPIVFQDIAEKAGLTTWKHTMGTPEKHFIIDRKSVV